MEREQSTRKMFFLGYNISAGFIGCADCFRVTMASGFDGECVLTVRALCKPLKSSALTARVATLATDLPACTRAEYLSWVLTADPYAGMLPR